jgi:hypothetical protein
MGPYAIKHEIQVTLPVFSTSLSCQIIYRCSLASGSLVKWYVSASTSGPTLIFYTDEYNTLADSDAYTRVLGTHYIRAWGFGNV